MVAFDLYSYANFSVKHPWEFFLLLALHEDISGPLVIFTNLIIKKTLNVAVEDSSLDNYSLF